MRSIFQPFLVSDWLTQFQVDSTRVSKMAALHGAYWRGRGRRSENCQMEQEGYSGQLYTSDGKYIVL
jgi:hypothetical protein